MNTKVLFLDLDGVLNGHEYDSQAESCTIKPECVEHLNKVLYVTGCNIVISSAWRYMVLNGAMTLKGFEYLLRTHKLRCKDLLLDTLPLDKEQNEAGRALLIEEWVEQHKPKKWAVVDDLALPVNPKNFVRTDGTLGLQQRNAEDLIAILL